MRRAIIIVPVASLILFFAGNTAYDSTDVIIPGPDIAMCGSPSGIVKPDAAGKFMTALKGWGDLKYDITSKNDSAKFYFNQGLSFYYGYHFTEAVASFKEASRFDPTSPMTYWGQALAMGPFYNTYVYKMPKGVPQVVADMMANISTADEKEKGLIDAMSKRYSNDLTNADRKQLDRNYATALSLLAKRYPDDNNIKALYIDAVMLEHKWDFWDNDGNPRAWTPELVSMCETVLKTEAHPAVMHYYIHLTEASRQPDRALSAADKLKDRLPAVGHMVHMSSHMYQRNGLYSKGVKVNEDAHNANNNLDTNAPGLSLGKNKSIHYYAVQSYCAMTAGMYKKGLPIFDRARDRQVAVKPDFDKETYPQFVYMMPVIARVRLGKWDEILQQPKPDDNWKYAVALDNFAKGLAYVRKNDLKSAKESLDALNNAMKDQVMSIRYMPFNTPLQSCKVASNILNGEILFAEGKTKESLEVLEVAVEEEDNLVYREPQDWLLPARQFLGLRLLKLNKAKDAEKVYREDLVMNPNNGWSLLGLYQSLKATGSNEAASYEAKYKKAFEESDVAVQASVF
jgi:tetratricopeptide (TPR) repeat protein